MSALQSKYNAIAAVLQSAAFFTAEPPIPVIVESKSDINAQIDARLTGTGLVVVVESLAGKGVRNANPGFKITDVTPAVTVYENPARNNTGATALDAVEAIIWYLRRAEFSDGDPVLPEGFSPIYDGTAPVSYEVTLKTKTTTESTPVRSN